MAFLGERRFPFVFSGYGGGRSLVAGDSNVHRIAACITDDSELDTLPISGARFVNDGNFKMLLERRLQNSNHERVYLHLGSNDACAREEVFYQHVAAMCDQIHTVNWSAEIVLCEILPRGPDNRRGAKRPQQDKTTLKRWVRTANNLLWDLCQRVPYIRFLGYPGFCENHLAIDGLHLNQAGARLCLGIIACDAEALTDPGDVKPAQQLNIDWPALPSSQIGTSEVERAMEESVRKSYAGVVEECPSVPVRTAGEGNSKGVGIKMMPKKTTTRRTTTYKRRSNRSFQKAARKWRLKTFARKHGARTSTLLDREDHVRLETQDGVEVLLKASKIQGLLTKRRCQPIERVPATPTATPNAIIQTTSKKRRNPIQWLSCPECSVKCSHEDFLLDHIIRRHVDRKDKEAEPCHESHSRCVDEPPSEADVGIEARKTDEADARIRDMPPCEGLFSIFPPSLWRGIFQLMTIGLLCGDQGLNHIMVTLLTQQDVNLSRILLLLANDVEQNPGPTYRCQWEACNECFERFSRIQIHVVEHIHRDKVCRWRGCLGCTETEFPEQTKHVVRHTYQSEESFPTLEDWYGVLTAGRYNEHTNLHLCPRNLRSKLQLLLFDEDFEMSSDPYDEAMHKDYLKRLSIQNSNFSQIEEVFLDKRKSLGEDWSWYTSSKYHKRSNSNTRLSPSATIATDESSHNYQQQLHYDFVQTTRPELCSQLFSGTVLKSNSNKRKQGASFEGSSSCTYTSWFNNLTQNLASCENAIKMQRSVLKIMFERCLVTAKNQSFIKLEQESSRLASINKCTKGTFVFTVFRCMLNETDFFYVRYVESGVYKGLMLQKFVNQLKEKYNISEDKILLHNVLTDEDITEMKNEVNAERLKRNRPDKVFNYYLQKLPSDISNLRAFCNCPEIKLESFVNHLLPYKTKFSVDSHEEMYLDSMNSIFTDVNKVLFEFRVDKVDSVEVSSKDILKEPSLDDKNLLQQSIALNCLSGNIKRRPDLFSRSARFESNFLEINYVATSLRYRTFQLYLQTAFDDLFIFFKKYFPELSGDLETNLESPVLPVVQSSKRRKHSTSVKRLTISRKDIEDHLSPSTNETIQDVNIYDNFCCSLVEHGKLSIQHFDDSGLLICCMNDYCELDGSFKQNDFVFTLKQSQETGDYFFCSCRIYKTLIDLKENHLIDEDFLVLDLEGTNCVTCMHCKFLKEKVIPALDEGNQYHSRINQFIVNAKKDIGKSIVELSVNNDTQKYSIIGQDEDRPSFVHFSFNKRLNNHVISCLNGKCVSLRGHKRSISTMLSSILCKHLTVFKEHPEFWQHLVLTENQNDLPESADVDNDTYNLETNNNDLFVDRDINFNEESGLWKFKCRSLHCPSKKDSILYKENVIKRDNWNDVNMVRLSDGCFKGPILVSDIPDNPCDCGAGWLTGKVDTSGRDTGITTHDKSRILTVYSSLGPVKCEVHTRLCNNSLNPCKLSWDEGKSDALHVLSRDTAAGDEIGWEFVSMVINSGCTFSAYCQLKTDSYKVRNSQTRFMDRNTFIGWWFSWAANMEIDFRKPCDVCGHEPKRLCCDGTKVGVGFRHAIFEEINASNQASQVQKTLHRRMSRCFLKNLPGVEKKKMILCRETLNYLARQVIGDLNIKEFLNPEELNVRINSVREILPEEITPSFDRFFNMPESEKLAYAYVLKMLCTTASVTSLLPAPFCSRLQQVVNNRNTDGQVFNTVINEMRSYAPEIRDLICESMLNNNENLPDDIRIFLLFLINESLSMESNEPEPAIPQPGTYNPAKFGKAYYFNELGLKLRDVRKFSIDLERNEKRNVDHDDVALDFERCKKLYSKVQTAAPGTSNLFLWFCADHGHCYGFHMTGAEGRKDPSASLYSYLDKPPTDIFYDFACNLQEYCLNRESGYYKNVRFFHDIFHSYAHKCSSAFKSNRLQGFESVNSEICEQFNSFIQCIKKSARQMSQAHFCFYLQFFLHEWNERKRLLAQKKMRIALAGLV